MRVALSSICALPDGFPAKYLILPICIYRPAISAYSFEIILNLAPTPSPAEGVTSVKIVGDDPITTQAVIQDPNTKTASNNIELE